MAGFDLADRLYIGLTQPNIRELIESPSASHRSQRYNNPLTYFERHELITDALIEASISRDRFEIVPFPIETPELVTDYLDRAVTCLTTVYDEWNRIKIERLRTLGYEVVVLWERDFKEIRGSAIRDAIRIGNDSWRPLVPKATRRLVEKLALQERLRSLWEESTRS